MEKDKFYIRQMFNIEKTRLKIRYEKEERDLLNKYMSILTKKEQKKLRKLEQKINRYPAIGSTKGYLRNSK